MIRINLLPVREIKAEVGRRRDLIIAGVSLGLAVVLLFGLYEYQTYRVSTLGAELAGLRKDIQTLNVKVKNVADLQNKIKELRSKNQVIEDLSERKIGPVRVMENLSAASPPALWLTEFKESGGQVVLTGMATDNQTVADFLKALSSSASFKNVELVETTQTDEKDGRQLKKFSIRSTVSYQSPARSSDGKQEGPGAGKKDKRG